MATTCVISGSFVGPDGQGLSGVTISVSLIQPFIYSATGELILNYSVSTSTDVTGAWSLTLVETETDLISLALSIDYPSGSGDYRKRDYTIIVPNTSTANFSDLIVGQ